jgi:glutaminyl-peptide cyclotransferase
MNMSRFFVVATALASGWVILTVCGAGQPEVKEPRKRERVPFAADRAVPPTEKAIAFDSKRALGYLKKICAIGPRISGTPGMQAQQDLLQKHFENLGARVVFQPFTARQSSQPRPVQMANIIVSWFPDRPRRVILCSHYDTRPIADQEPDPRRWREKFLSANDGGSGVAFLMELGHHMKDIKTNVGVDFVFFDGEEYIFNPDRDQYFFGSKHFAQAWRKDRNRVDYQAAILFDMIAGESPAFLKEGFSWNRAGRLLHDIWSIAAEVQAAAFVNRVGESVLDDHLALQNVGIPAIDIIHWGNPHWHRLSDIPENCSPEGLDQVARVVTVWLQRLR